MEQERGRSKRKTQHFDSEPPSKSPAGTPQPSPIGTPIPSPGQSPLGSPSHSPCRSPIRCPSPLASETTDQESLSRQGSINRKTIRASRRRQSTGDVTWNVSPSASIDTSNEPPSFASLAKHNDQNMEEARDTFGDMPSFGGAQAGGHNKFSGPAFREYRPGSKDLLDDYLARKKDARRRSSCKEITLQLMRQDTAEMTDPNEPRFRLLERQRRLTIANKLMESISDSCESLPPPTNPLDSLVADPLDKSPSLRLRSRSAEGYDASEVKDKVTEKKALLFDSTPDLLDDEEVAKFNAARRSRRRGAVCYDVDNALDLLKDLQLDDIAEIPDAQDTGDIAIDNPD